MKKQHLLNITNRHYKKVKQYAGEIIKGYDASAIHHFRVSYKKLRAFLRLLSCNAGGKIMIPKELKKAYAVSGDIRKLQLQERRVLQATRSTPKKPRPYLNLLQQEIDKLQPRLGEILSHDPVSTSKKKIIAMLPGKFPVNNFRLFGRQKWSAIYRILASGKFSDDNIHSLRKALKDLIYVLSNFKNSGYPALPAIILNGKSETSINNLITQLGDFQDQCGSLSLLKSGWLVRLNAYNRNLLEKLRKDWIRDKIKMKQALIKELKKNLLPPERENKRVFAGSLLLSTG